MPSPAYHQQSFPTLPTPFPSPRIPKRTILAPFFRMYGTSYNNSAEQRYQAPGDIETIITDFDGPWNTAVRTTQPTKALANQTKLCVALL